MVKEMDAKMMVQEEYLTREKENSSKYKMELESQRNQIDI
jgi:hypothetical protein